MRKVFGGLFRPGTRTEWGWQRPLTRQVQEVVHIKKDPFSSYFNTREPKVRPCDPIFVSITGSYLFVSRKAALSPAGV
jgi:hypothetical protein